MKQRPWLIFLILVLICTGETAQAAVPPESVTVEITPSTTEVTVGDSLTIFCTLSIPENVRAGVPELMGENPFLEVSNQWHRADQGSPGERIELYGFLTYIFAPDSLSVGPFRVAYATADGDTASAFSNVLTFEVKGYITDPKTPPKPHRNPFAVSSEGLPAWLIILLIALGVFALSTLVYCFLRKNRHAVSVPPPEPVDEIGEFERIREMHLAESGRFKDLYTLTSKALRAFMHRNMGFEALYDTTGEIVTHLSKHSSDDVVKREILEIFEESDMVKFAKFIPPCERSTSVVDRSLKPVKTVLEEIKREQARLAAADAAGKIRDRTAALPEHREGGT